MVKMTKTSDNNIQYLNEYIADKKEDIKELIKEKCAAGSICFCIEDSSVYMKTTEGKWKEI